MESPRKKLEEAIERYARIIRAEKEEARKLREKEARG